MDFARKIGKPGESPTWKRRLSFVTTRDKFLSEDTNFISENNCLLNWKKWLAERKKLNHRIESSTGRSQVDQLQSFTDRFRTLVEIKDLMEHATMSTSMVPDKYRGGPEFWRIPEYLPTHSDICLPQISLTPTRKDLNFPPDLMCVGLPNLIAKEQSFTALKIKEDFWKRSEYLKTRKFELAEEISLLLPKEPEMTTLAIQGHIFRKLKPQWQIPPITITEFNDKQESCSEDANQTVILRIQDQEFIWQSFHSEKQSINTDPIMWSLIFDSKIDERVEKEIVLENKGTRVIVYYWRNSSFRSSNIIFERRDNPFSFNKTKGLVLLGQTVRIKVWFVSKNRGVFTESWQLVTEPKLSPSVFILRFWGCTIGMKCLELADHRAIEEYLDCCMQSDDSVIRTIIEEIVSRIEYSKLPYETLFSRNDLFSFQNSCHYYHPSIIMQLQKMYCDIANERIQLWNLSLDTLQDIFLQIENLNYKRDMLARFNDFCKQSLRPDITRSDIAHNSKYNAVYNILCSFTNLFDDESEFVKKKCLSRRDLEISITNRQKLIFSSQRFENNLLKAYSEKLIDRTQEMLMVKEEESLNLNLQSSYREVSFVRIYKALEETIERICASIDFYIKLNELNKHIRHKC